MKSFFNFAVTLSWSKIVALIMLILAFSLDIYHKSGGSIWMFTVPFVVFLITGKQLIDKSKDV